MDFETPRSSSELAPDLQFLSYESVDDLRKQQKDAVYAAEREVEKAAVANGTFASSEALRAARQSAEANFGNQTEAFVSNNLDREADPERYDRVLELVQACSLDHMSTTKWRHGDVDEDGNYDFTTSGSYQLEQELRALSPQPEEVAEPQFDPDADPIRHGSPEADAVYGPLISARTRLAELSIARRKLIRKGGNKAERLSAEYDEARAAYEAALQNVTAFYVNSYREANWDDEAIHAKVLPRLIDEHGTFTKTELEILENDDSLRGRFARFLSECGAMYGLSAVSGLAIGAVARTVGKGFLMTAAGITGGAAAGGVIAMRAVPNLLLAKVRSNVALIKESGKRQTEDQQTLTKHYKSIENRPLDDSVRSMHAKLGEVITSRVEKDRRTNARRAIFSTVLGASVAAVAIELTPCIEHTIVGWFHDNDVASVPGNTTTPPTYTPPAGTNPFEVPGHGAPETPYGVTAPPHVSGGGSLPTPPSTPDTVDGFHTHVKVEPGNGFIREIQDLALQKNIHLNLNQATDAYYNVLHHAGSNFLPNDPTYIEHSDFRISHPGPAIWDPAHIHALNNWLQAQEAEGKVAA